MNTVLWSAQVALALVFAAAGLLKLTQPIDVLEARVGGWVHDLPLALTRTVAALEVVGAIGLVLPAAVGVAPWLTWLAALGLAVIMLGAIVVHGRRGEPREVILNVVLTLLLVLVVWGRLGPYAF